MDPTETLSTQLMAAEWKVLAMHHKRDALFMVTGDVAILDAAVAVAGNDTRRVEAWLGGGELARPEPADVEVWEGEEGALFDMIIVQPYVLARRR